MPQRNTDPVTMDPIEPHRRVVANRQAYNVHSLAEIVHRASHHHRAAVLPHSRREITPEEAARWISHAEATGWAPAAGAQMTNENRRVPDHLRAAAAAELARREAIAATRPFIRILDRNTSRHINWGDPLPPVMEVPTTHPPMVYRNRAMYRYRGELLPAEEIRRRNPAVDMMFLSRWTPTLN